MTLFVVIFSIGVFVFIWKVPSEAKKTHTSIAFLFIFNLNVYVLSPLLTIIKNASLKKFAAKKIRPNLLNHLYLNKVSPA